MHDEQVSDHCDERNRREIAQRVVRQLLEYAGIDRVPRVHHQYRIAVGRRLGDDIAADDPIGTGPIVDDDALAETLRQR